jgi:hypothetical protein
VYWIEVGKPKSLSAEAQRNDFRKPKPAQPKLLPRPFHLARHAWILAVPLRVPRRGWVRTHYGIFRFWSNLKPKNPSSLYMIHTSRFYFILDEFGQKLTSRRLLVSIIIESEARRSKVEALVLIFVTRSSVSRFDWFFHYFSWILRHVFQILSCSCWKMCLG